MTSPQKKKPELLTSLGNSYDRDTKLSSSGFKAIEDVRLYQKQTLTAQEYLGASSSTCDNLINDMCLLALTTGMLDKDIFQANQMLKQPDKDKFIKDMDKEMEGREVKH